MATVTTPIPSAVPSTFYQSIWPEVILSIAEQESIFGSRGMVGDGPNFPVRMLRDAKLKDGNTMNISLVRPFIGAGVTGDTRLTGAEEAMCFSQTVVTLASRRNAATTTGKYSDRYSWVKISKESIPELGRWLGHMKDYSLFAAAAANFTYTLTPGTNTNIPPHGVVFGGGREAVNQITGADKMTAQVIKKLAAKAGARSLRKIPVPGYPGLVRGILFVSPGQSLDLSNDPEWIDAQKDARNRGDDNPIFTGMDGMYRGVVVHTVESTVGMYGVTGGSLLPITVGNTGFDTVEAIFVAGNGLACGSAIDAEVGQLKDTDYDWIMGTSIATIIGFAKTTINVYLQGTIELMDYGVLYACTAASKVA